MPYAVGVLCNFKFAKQGSDAFELALHHLAFKATQREGGQAQQTDHRPGSCDCMQDENMLANLTCFRPVGLQGGLIAFGHHYQPGQEAQ